MSHEENINKMGFPVNSKSLLAIPFQNNGYSIPKKKFAAMIHTKKHFPSSFLNDPVEVESEFKEDCSHDDISESGFMVDGLNFCKSI